MRIVIIEDEKPAAERLKKAIFSVDGTLEPVAVLSSVSSSIRWFKENPAPDLVFMDIELSDGNGFTILKESRLNCPVIFTTAYDEYWQEAFEHNSIDYLLKPIRLEKLHQAIEKYQKLKLQFATNNSAASEQAKIPNGPKKRFLIKKGTDLITLKTEEIAYAYAAHKMAFLVDARGNKYIQDKSLSEIEEELDPAMFFRINRKWLLNIHHIKRIRTLGKSKLSLELNPPVSEEIVISQENASKFKVWIAG